MCLASLSGFPFPIHDQRAGHFSPQLLFLSSRMHATNDQQTPAATRQQPYSMQLPRKLPYWPPSTSPTSFFSCHPYARAQAFPASPALHVLHGHPQRPVTLSTAATAPAPKRPCSWPIAHDQSPLQAMLLASLHPPTDPSMFSSAAMSLHSSSFPIQLSEQLHTPSSSIHTMARTTLYAIITNPWPPSAPFPPTRHHH